MIDPQVQQAITEAVNQALAQGGRVDNLAIPISMAAGVIVAVATGVFWLSSQMNRLRQELADIRLDIAKGTATKGELERVQGSLGAMETELTELRVIVHSLPCRDRRGEGRGPRPVPAGAPEDCPAR